MAPHPECGQIQQWNDTGAEIAPRPAASDLRDPFMPDESPELLADVLQQFGYTKLAREERRAANVLKRTRAQEKRRRDERRAARPIMAALRRMGVISIYIEVTRHAENEERVDTWYEEIKGKELDILREGVLNRGVDEIWNGNRGGDTERNVELFGPRISITVRCNTAAGCFHITGKRKERAERLMRVDGCDLGFNKI